MEHSPQPETSPLAPGHLLLFAHLPLFANLEPHEVAFLGRAARRVRCRAGTPILTCGERGVALYGVLEGTLRVCRPLAHREPVSLNLVGPSEVVGEMDFLDNCGHTASVVAAEASLVLRIGRQALFELCENRKELRRAMECLALQRFRLVSERQAALATRSLQQRVALLLVEFSDRFLPNQSGHQSGEAAIPLHMTQSDLADMAGGTRSRTGECLKRFEERGLVRFKPRRRIVLVNRGALAALGEGTQEAITKEKRKRRPTEALTPTGALPPTGNS